LKHQLSTINYQLFKTMPNFATPLTNPFGLADAGSFSIPTFADIDDDGDLDAFVGAIDGNTRFFQNNGTASNPSFAAPVTNPFGLADVGLSSSPTFADIDGDGDLDAFVGEQDGNTRFFQNNGTASNPSFAAPITNPFGLADAGSFSRPTFADIDGDGDLDAFVGENNGNTRFFQNNGTASSPSFAAPITNPFGLTDVGERSSPTFADIDGDGDLDAFVGAGDGNTRFFQNNGTASNPSVAAPLINPFGLTDVGFANSPTFTDIDGDGDLDALVGALDGNTRFFENTSPAVNIDPATTPSEAGTTPVVGNFVVTLNQPAPTGGLTVTYSVSGTATNGSDYTTLPGSAFIPAGLTTAIINVTPILDNIVDPSETVQVKLTATPASPYNLGKNKTAVLRITDQVPLNFTTSNNNFGLTDVGLDSSPTFADIDGDGDLDAFVGANDGNTRFFQNNGTASSPNFAAPVTNPFGLVDVGLSSSPTFADIDADGDLDAFVGEGFGNIRFFRNTGTASSPSFAAPVTNPFGLTFGITDAVFGSSPTFADIDGDGDLDAFVGPIDGNTRFFQNTGTASSPNFAAPVTNPFGLVDVGGFNSPTFADVDADGDLDAVVGESDGNTRFFQNTGTASNPSFAAPVTNAFGLTDVGDRSSPTFADIDGDSDLDAFVGTRDGNTFFFENAPTVAITPDTPAAEPNTTGTFNLTLSQPAPDGGITVNYTIGGSATNGTDYTTLSGSVTFAAGTNTTTVDVVPIDDTVFEGNETVEITLTDGARYNLGTTSNATLTLTDNELASSPPNAVDDTATVSAYTLANLNVLANDSDPNGDPLQLSIHTAPTNGTATVNNNGTPGNLTDDFIVYTPAFGYSGSDSFIYQVNDGNGGIDLATVAVTVTGANLTGNASNNTLLGTDAADTLNGAGGNDSLVGNAENDLLDGGTGISDRLFGGDGNDSLSDPDGVFAAQGGAGNDSINVTFSATWDNNTTVGDAPRSSNAITGGFGNDNITVTMNNSLFVLNLTGDEPVNNPLDGNDEINLLGSYARSTVNLGGGDDLFVGGVGVDSVVGSGGNDSLLGNGGIDRLTGNEGNDTLIGGGGNDNLTGNTGVDSFVYQATTDARDTITDFTAIEDVLVLTELFDSLGYAGTNPITDGFLRFVQSGANTNVQIDSNGGANSFITLATLNNVLPTNLVVGTNVLI
jgi:large repetitive protein